jgi:hypothetical protein
MKIIIALQVCKVVTFSTFNRLVSDAMMSQRRRHDAQRQTNGSKSG